MKIFWLGYIVKFNTLLLLVILSSCNGNQNKEEVISHNDIDYVDTLIEEVEGEMLLSEITYTIEDFDKLFSLSNNFPIKVIGFYDDTTLTGKKINLKDYNHILQEIDSNYCENCEYYALFKVQFSNLTVGYAIRAHGEYDATQIHLFLFDTLSHYQDRLMISETFGDAGDYYEVNSVIYKDSVVVNEVQGYNGAGEESPDIFHNESVSKYSVKANRFLKIN